jgi:spore germination cell wall hydrolase CwlJ-like protein
MKFRNFRVGVFAPVAILLVSLFGAGTPVAWAQDQAPPAYFAEEVVQPLPAEDSLEARVAEATSLHQLVGDMPIAEELSAEMRCLAQAVYFESRGEPLAGQLAVAKVVINRASSGRYPPDYCAVITQRAQFSFVRNGRIPAADESSEAWRRAKAIAQIAHQDLWQSEARDALFFHANYVNPSWARRKTQLARIDTHIFYR